MKTLRFLATLTLTLTLTASAFAVPALRTFRTYSQPDGTTVSLQKIGDEFGHYFLTEDGRMVLESGNGYFFATLDAQGKPAPSNVLAADRASRTQAQSAFVAGMDAATLQQAFSEKKKTARLNTNRPTLTANGPARAHEGLFPNVGVQHSGSPHFIVILVQYTDVKFKTSYQTSAKDYFTNMLTQEGFSEYNGTGSAYDFFNQASMGQFTPQFDVYGPITLSNKQSYYGGNDSWGNDKHPEEMVIEACQQLDDTVDFTQYDTDDNGVVDNVFIFYAGQGEASNGSANTVWPHAWDLSAAGRNLICDGVKIDGYGCTNEWESGEPDGVGTFVHEFSHVLGLPDLYTTDYNSSAEKLTPGEWDVMDYGPYNNDGRTPPTYSIFERNAMSWMEPTELIAGEGVSAELGHIFDTNQGFIINSPNPPSGSSAEFFLLENRQKQGWDKYLPGHGMLIWHIDYKASVWTNNTPNNSSSHQYIDIEEANGTANNTNSSTMARYPFPGTSNVTSFNKFTTWRGTTLNYPLTNIKEQNGVITFDVCGGAPAPEPETVATPVITPESGTYNEMPEVAINCETEGATIYYTLDADTEFDSATWTVYEALFYPDNKAPTFTVRAIAVKADCTNSEIASATYTVETTGIFNLDFDADVDVEYYNMQGMRVLNPTHGYYIRKQRGTVSKVYVR